MEKLIGLAFGKFYKGTPCKVFYKGWPCKKGTKNTARGGVFVLQGLTL